MFKQLYTDIETQLRSLDAALTAAGLEPIGTIDAFNDQYNPMMMREELALKYPACLIEFLMQEEWKDNSQGWQDTTLTVRIHVVMRRHAEGREGSRDQATFLKLYDLPDFILAKLHRFAGGDYMTGLLRRRNIFPPSHDAVYVHVLEFATKVQDDGAWKLKDYIQSEGNHEVEVTSDQTLLE